VTRNVRRCAAGSESGKKATKIQGIKKIVVVTFRSTATFFMRQETITALIKRIKISPTETYGVL
jgi:hypothetical protein